MNSSNPLLEIAQQGFRITVGAGTSLLETVQNPQKRSEAISQLQIELNEKAREWSQKGEITEQEARTFINNVIARQPWTKGSKTTTDGSEGYSNSNPGNNVRHGLQELKDEIVALRMELEKMRNSGNN